VAADTHAQVEAGADMLDVNAGIPLVDEAELLATMLQTVQAEADIPICIDSSVIEALGAGLAVTLRPRRRNTRHPDVPASTRLTPASCVRR